jgi:hypothetical protein
LEISPKAARFPHFHSSGDEADGKVENQEQVFHFPTAPGFYLSKRKKKKNKTRAGFAPRPRRRSAPAPKRSGVIVVDQEK